MDLRSELTEAKAERAVVEREVHDQLLQIHALQLQLHAKQGQDEDSDTIKDRLVGQKMNKYFTLLKKVHKKDQESYRRAIQPSFQNYYCFLTCIQLRTIY